MNDVAVPKTNLVLLGIGMPAKIRIAVIGILIYWVGLAIFQDLCYASPHDVGMLEVTPNTFIAGRSASWKAIYTIGSERLKKGSSIKVQFPNSWHQNPWLFKSSSRKDKQEQTLRPEDWHYVGVTTSRDGVELKTTIARLGLDSQEDRFGRSFVVAVENGELLPGDQVILEYKRTTAPATSEVSMLQIGVDVDGDGRYEQRLPPSEIAIRNDTEKSAMLLVPSRVQVNTPVQFAVIVLDRYNNPVEDFAGQFSFTSSDMQADVPSVYDFQPEDKGWKTFSVTFKTPGVHYITAHDNKYLASTGLLSNPVEVTVGKPDYYIFWGDLHSHCEHSKDGVGRAETAFQYARDISRLDFYALTDHAEGDGNKLRHDRETGKTPDEWQANKELVEQYYAPGRFVTFLGYEWSAPAPFGHNNIIYPDPDSEIIYHADVAALPELWKALAGKRVLTIPHHTGIVFGGNRSGFKAELEKKIMEKERGAFRMTGVDWNFKHPLRTSVEIYSLHGSSEFYGAPNKYEDVDNVVAASYPGPHYARDAWAMGQVIGVAGGSDDHMAHPGMIHGGLSAVLASTLDRESIYEAIVKRHTYATTGHRILLSFTLNDHLMGDVVQLGEHELPRIQVKASAMDTIGLIQVMKFDGFEWTLVYENSPRASTADFSFIDHGFTSSSLYYVRLQQEREFMNNMEYRGRKVMAWSSPIWVSRLDNPWWTGAEAFRNAWAIFDGDNARARLDSVGYDN